MDFRITRRRIPEEIADHIEQLILRGELATNQAFPPERELASRMGVSRNTLREAVRILEARGLVEVRSGTGAYIRDLNPAILTNGLRLLACLRAKHLFELIEARKAIEVELAGLAAERATSQDLTELRSWLSQMEGAMTPDEYVQSDVAFHTCIASAAKNDILRIMLNSIRSALSENIRVLLQHSPEARREAMEYHRQIFDALSNRSPKEAREKMRAHLDAVQRRLHELQEEGILT